MFEIDRPQYFAVCQSPRSDSLLFAKRRDPYSVLGRNRSKGNWLEPEGIVACRGRMRGDSKCIKTSHHDK
jgi:hypothetical protein